MWLIVMFDLPMVTKEEKARYTTFRKSLLEDGFKKMQFSVYMRHCASEENAQVHIQRIKAILPVDGEVRVIKITDKQFGRIDVFFSQKKKKAESAPRQLSFF